MKGLPRFPHEMILEGGSIHVDGEGKKFHCFSSFTANSFVKNLYFLHTKTNTASSACSCDQLPECISPHNLQNPSYPSIQNSKNEFHDFTDWMLDCVLRSSCINIDS